MDLFAALDIARGTVITDIKKHHTQVEFIGFLSKINREVPAELEVHVILDNLATHKTPKVQEWLLVPSPVPFPFHTNVRVVDEHGRTVVLGADD